MDVFSLLKFWRNAGVGDSIDDDEGSFYDLVFSTHNDSPQLNIITSGFHSNTHHQQCSSMNEDLKSNKSNHTYYYSSPNNNKRKLLPFDSSNTNTKTRTPRSPFRVLMLGLNNTKSKSGKEMKCEMQEVVTISSLLKRDEGYQNQNQMQSKRFSKDVVNRYLNDLIIKPLTSRRSSQQEKPKPSIFKRFGNNRSSSSVVKPVPSPAVVVRRNDTEDGIQSAILHCKKSYNSPSQGSNVLSRSGSAPTHGTRISVDEEKRSSI